MPRRWDRVGWLQASALGAQTARVMQNFGATDVTCATRAASEQRMDPRFEECAVVSASRSFVRVGKGEGLIAKAVVVQPRP